MLTQLVSSTCHTNHNSPAGDVMSLCHQVTAVKTHCVQNFSVHHLTDVTLVVKGSPKVSLEGVVKGVGSTEKVIKGVGSTEGVVIWSAWSG